MNPLKRMKSFPNHLDTEEKNKGEGYEQIYDSYLSS